ncbi:MAG: hypothetical protein ACFFD1_00980 [Candidatus Thorarchaeota archaeon]
MENKNYLTQKRIVGIGLMLFSVLGMIIFQANDWNGDGVFYLSFGWGVGMLL